LRLDRCSAISSPIMGTDKDRDERLAAALRENLKRRKAQSREIDAGEKPERSER
jgi:hypothetical protein